MDTPEEERRQARQYLYERLVYVMCNYPFGSAESRRQIVLLTRKLRELRPNHLLFVK